MSLTVRLNLIITALLIVVMLIGAILTVRSAQEDVRAEVQSTASLAMHLLDAEILHYTSDYAWLTGADRNKASIFRLQSLENIRHLRIEFFDAYGRLRDSNRKKNEVEEDVPPAWFFRLMDVGSPEGELRRKVFANGRILGELVVTPDPTYEIAEIWNDTQGLLWLAATFFIFVNAMVYWAVKSALHPVDSVIAALSELEKGHLDARLPQFDLPELAGLSSKFNAMAKTLQQSISSNHRLTQKVIRLQEDERKSLARELHDEIGQHMTAINVDAQAIMESNSLQSAKRSAEAIMEVAIHMLDIVRTMLQRLRPGVLDELGLSIALNEHVTQWRQRNHGISSSISIAGDLGEPDEAVALAAYRIVQESLTNITRHASARHVKLIVKRTDGKISIELEDDGKGFEADGMSDGYGVAGMRERVQGLGGRFEIVSQTGLGTRITVQLPCDKVVE